MTHYIIFERTSAHCITMLYQGASLTDALTKYAINECGAERQTDGSLVDSTGAVCPHPLAIIESERKSNRQYDELQLNAEGPGLVNESSWEIRELPSEAWDAESADIFCSANPTEISEYIRLCRVEFRKQHPRSRARAFVWHLTEEPLVTFYQSISRNNHQIKILGRYLIKWEHWPQVQEWQGTYHDIADRMHVRFPPEGYKSYETDCD